MHLNIGDQPLRVLPERRPQHELLCESGSNKVCKNRHVSATLLRDYCLCSTVADGRHGRKLASNMNRAAIYPTEGKFVVVLRGFGSATTMMRSLRVLLGIELESFSSVTKPPLIRRTWNGPSTKLRERVRVPNTLTSQYSSASNYMRCSLKSTGNSVSMSGLI